MNNKTKRIHEAYHQRTKPSYKIIKDNNFTYHLIIDVINRYLKHNMKEILDIGCGAGSLSIYLANKSLDVTGIDISQKSINECVKTAKFLNLKKAKFIRADFPVDFKTNKKYDIIIFTEVIEHIENDQLAIEKIYKLLKPSGLLILSTPSVKAPLHKLGLTRKFDIEVGHVRRYSLPNLKDILTKNGFRIINIEKTEGIVRNFLFVNPIAGKLVRYINFFGSGIVNFVDKISLKLFGESNYIIVAKKNHK